MAFRLFIGGLPLDCRHDDLASWVFGLCGVWPATRQLMVRGSGSTLQCGFLGFTDVVSMQCALNALQRYPNYGGRRTTVSVSRDSKGHGKGVAAPVAAPVAAQGVASGVQAVVDMVEIATQATATMGSLATQATATMVDTEAQTDLTMDALDVLEKSKKVKAAKAQTNWSFEGKTGWSASSLQDCGKQEVATAEISPTEPAHSPTISRTSRSRSPTPASSPPPTVLVEPGVAKEESDLAAISRQIMAAKEELAELKGEQWPAETEEEKDLAKPVA